MTDMQIQEMSLAKKIGRPERKTSPRVRESHGHHLLMVQTANNNVQSQEHVQEKERNKTIAINQMVTLIDRNPGAFEFVNRSMVKNIKFKIAK